MKCESVKARKRVGMVSLGPYEKAPPLSLEPPEAKDKQLIRKFPKQLLEVSELRLPFSDEEVKNGVLIEEGSNSMEVWELLANTSDFVVDPYTNKKSPAIEDLERSAASACESEIEAHAAYLAVADQLSSYDENCGGIGIKEHTRLMNLSDELFHQWELARARAERLKKAWHIFCDDRVSRLEKALKKCDQLHADDQAPSTPPTSPTPPTLDVGQANVPVVPTPLTTPNEPNPWAPCKKFSESISSQLEELKSGILTTPYFTLQNCVARITGRPLFSPSELTTAMVLKTEREDPIHRKPVLGTVLERYELFLCAV